jgi:hypothetical protein
MLNLVFVKLPHGDEVVGRHMERGSIDQKPLLLEAVALGHMRDDIDVEEYSLVQA